MFNPVRCAAFSGYPLTAPKKSCGTIQKCPMVPLSYRANPLPLKSSARVFLMVYLQGSPVNIPSPSSIPPLRSKKLKHLTFKNPVLFFDNDTAGRKATEKAAAIVPNAKAVDWSIAPDGCKDINDLLRGGHQGTIYQMVETAIPCKVVGTPTIADTILDINAFCAVQFPDRKEYLSPWLKEAAIVLITGYRGVGKTFFALCIADAVTDGKSFGPWKCENSAPVLYLDGEMPPQDIVERANGLKLNTPRKTPFYIYSDAYTNQMGLPRANLADEEWRSKMKQTLLDKAVKLFFVDNLASLAAGIDENSKQDSGPHKSMVP